MDKLVLQPCRVLGDGNVASVLQPSERSRMPASKVIVTIGPATRDTEVMKELLGTGIAAVRFDLTWGTLQYHLDSLANLHAATKSCKRLCSVCLALTGRNCSIVQKYTLQPDGFPLYDRPIVISEGQPVIVTADPNAQLVVPEDKSQTCILPVSNGDLTKLAKVGDTVNVERYLVTALEELCVSMQVVKVNQLEVHCIARGPLNIHGAAIVRHIPHNATNCVVLPLTLNEPDKAAMRAFRTRDALDFVILGDINDASDVETLRDYLDGIGAIHTKIIATLQSARSLLNFGAIAQLVDGIILARGALGLHVLPEKMAVVQKRVTSLCNLIGKPCIVTSILDSMQENPRPTRAEATDVANSVIDGADAFLLGPETVRGRHPVLCVKTVLGICREAEAVFDNIAHYDSMMAVFREPTCDRSSPAWVQSKLGSKSMVFGENGSLPGALDGNSSGEWEPDDPTRPGMRRSSLSYVTTPQPEQPTMQSMLSAINESISGSQLLPDSEVDILPTIASGGTPNVDDAFATMQRASSSGQVPITPGSGANGPLTPQGGRSSDAPNPPSGRPPLPPGFSPSEGSELLLAPQTPPPLTNQQALHVSVGYPSSSQPEHSVPHQAPFHRHHRHHVGPKFGSYSDLAMGAMRRGTISDMHHTHGLHQRVASWGSLANSPMGGSPSGSQGNLCAMSQALQHSSRSATDNTRPQLTLTSVEVSASSAVVMADHIKSPLLLVVTDTGHTASLVAKYRPEMPILALVVPHVVKSGVSWGVEGATVARQCSLLRGVVPMLAAPGVHGLLPTALQRAVEMGLVTHADHVVAMIRLNTMHTGRCLTVQVVNVGECISGDPVVSNKVLQ